MRPKEYTGLIYRKEGNRVTIILNRPEVLNAFSPDLYWETAWALMEAEADPEVLVVVITGNGRAFSAGGDLREVDRLHREGHGALVGHIFTTPSHALFYQLERMDKVVVVAVNGLAHGAGLITVLCADLAVASEQASFRSPEPLSGVAEPYTSSRLALRVGLARARQIVFTCEEVGAQEAARIGLVNETVPHDQLAAATDQLVAKVLQTEAGARAWYKRAMRSLLPAFELKSQIMTVGSVECALGVRDFVEKRGKVARTKGN